MRAVLLMIALLCVQSSAWAQLAPRRFEQDSARIVRGWSPVRLAKWSVLLASSGAVVYGFTQNRSADREYEAIERLCEDAPAQCALKTGTDEYADPALESRYRSVLQRDDRAKLALVAGQVGLAASLLLFIIDLPKDTTPDDIPYDPRPLRFGMRTGQLQMGFHFAVGH